MIRVAILGAGIGAEHLAGYRNLPDMFLVSVVCDLNVARAAEIIGDDASIEITHDVESVLQNSDVDLIDICLPPHLHFSMTLRALDAGKHVVCEKPLVTSLAEADALIAKEQETGRRVFPVFQYRYGPATNRIRALIEAGLAGKPLVASLETHWNRGSEYYAVDWRGTWAGESGGAVLGHAIHNHDYLMLLMGPVSELTATVATRVNEIEVEDCAAISMRMANGALATSSVTLGGATDTTRIRLVYDKLTAESGTEPYAPAIDAWTYTARDPGDQDKVDDIVAAHGDVKSGFVGFFQDIYQALEGGPETAVSLMDGRRSIELVTSVYQSARSGKTVRLPLNEEADFYEGWLP
ncbi:putative dehydrogenase [Shimia isoporae]|uniref:Putative dehydrogenase n=1 Tax=Shimia isoporae TaxID=647720 RepID=A0A4R1N382_9RHOB|nr:Gfo/Idh/MocA family oxidoreductase [Shimia isoporae]TCL00789.1 putative dehydrogenase [Shimia isoporae]